MKAKSTLMHELGRPSARHTSYGRTTIENGTATGRGAFAYGTAALSAAKSKGGHVETALRPSPLPWRGFHLGLGRLDAAKVAHTARLRLTTNAAFQSAL